MSANRKNQRRSFRALASIAIFCVGSGLLAGCGGSSKLAGSTQRASQTPFESNADTRHGSPPAAPAGTTTGKAQLRTPARSPVGRTERATAPADSSKDDVSHATQFNPCNLVSIAEAQSIVGGTIAGRVEAPLGPTCLYRLGGSKSEITVSIESQNLSSITREMANRSTVVVGHRHAYCGRLGTQMLFLPLADGQVLHVTARCSVAQRFAAFALTRLAA